MKYKVGAVYFGILGVLTAIFGGMYIVLAITGRDILTDLLAVSGSMWSLWKGLIMFFAGIFVVAGAKNLKNVHGIGKAVLGSMMLWIVAGSNIFGRITSSIPGEESWFNSLEGFLSSYGPPYEPALWLLPFSLLILYYVTKSRRQK